MYLNSKILYGVRSQKDVASLSKAQLERLVVAIRAAETLIGMGLRSQEYVSRFRYGEVSSIIQGERLLIRSQRTRFRTSAWDTRLDSSSGWPA
jgi:hypothetical protein